MQASKTRHFDLSGLMRHLSIAILCAMALIGGETVAEAKGFGAYLVEVKP